MFEIAIHRSFAASHAVRLPGGAMESSHSHQWQVWVAVGRAALDDDGFVMDFHELQELVDGAIARLADRDMNKLEPFAASADGGEARFPTAERVAWWIGERVAEGLPAEVRLACVRVEEAPGCTASYRP